MDRELFVQNVKKYCELAGIKPTVACRECKVGTSFINNIERRNQTPSVEKVQMLAQYLGVTTSELLGEEEKPTPTYGDGLSEDQLSVRERIFAQLKSKSIQQKDFAKAIGVKEVTITDWKNGKSTSFMKRLVPIAEYLGVTTSELLGEEEKPTPTYGDGLTPEFIRLYEQLSKTEKEFVVKQMRGLLSQE